MAISQPTCPQCGTPVVPGQRFCQNCGATTDPGFSNPTASASGGAYPVGPDMAVGPSVPPPPPPINPYSTTEQQSIHTYYPPQAQQSYQPTPAFAQPQKDSSKSVLGQIGCGVLLVILLIVGLCGGTAYFGYRWLTSAVNSGTTGTSSSSDTGTGSGTNSGSSGTTSSVSATTKSINATITYASIETTIVNVQEASASSFADDRYTDKPVTVRVNLKEHNPTAGTVYITYSNSVRLILPDKSSTPAGQSKQSGIISQAVTQTNWIDFPLDKEVPTDQLVLRYGGENEARIDVPLTGNADVSKYQAKTISPNATFQYAGQNWTMMTVTSSLSADGKQADRGMRYIVITLKEDNPTSGTYYPNPSNDIRLKSGGITNAPTNSTFPAVVNAGTTGTKGTVTFLMPDNNSSFTLIMLAHPDASPPVLQVTKDFQI